MTARRPPPPAPVTVLTGFLGAGKTTLLNAVARSGALADTVVLINEFGEIGLDHLLADAVDGDMLLLASGCVCCTIRGDLVNALEGLLRRLDNGRIAFRRVVIETTGLADPAPVLQTILGHPYFAMRFRLDAVVAVVDAVNGAAAIERHCEAARQVAVADRIVVTKTDLASGDEQAALTAALDRLNARAPRLSRDAAQAGALFGGEATAFAGGADAPAWMRDDHPHHHHGHDVNRHNASIRAVNLVRAAPMSAQALDIFLDLLRAAHAPRLLRVKGLVALADDPTRPLVVHGVRHVLHPPARLAAWPDGDARTRLVVIVDGVDPTYVTGLFASVCGDIAPDRADVAALTANPLRPGAGGLLA